jgi:chromosome segregation ATPase
MTIEIKPDWQSAELITDRQLGELIDELEAPREQPDIVQQVRSLVNDKAVLESKLKDLESQRLRLQIAVDHATRNIEEEKDSSVSKSRLLSEMREDAIRLQETIAELNRDRTRLQAQRNEALETIHFKDREYAEIVNHRAQISKENDSLKKSLKEANDFICYRRQELEDIGEDIKKARSSAFYAWLSAWLSLGSTACVVIYYTCFR